MAAKLRIRLLGLLFVAVLVGGIALSIALYDKAFTTFTTVKLQASSIGNQLLTKSDVKVRGLIVGSVQSIEPTRTGAEVTLNLDPAMTELIPANVSARLLPKTLFGERFVSLVLPPDPVKARLGDGDVITEDRTSSAVELQTALGHLMPVLKAVQPQKLSSTLTAISTALQGRGKDLGTTLSELGQYLGELNPQVPQLQRDLKELATFSDNLAAAAPDLVDTLDNLTVTSRTVVDQQANLSNLYGSLTTASYDLRNFLQANSPNLIALAKNSRPTLELLARYAPEYPCFLGQLSELVPVISRALGAGTDKPGLHAKVEIVANRGPYVPGKDDPKFTDHRGPRCYAIKNPPDPFPQQPPDGKLQDGTSMPAAPRTANTGLNPSETNARAGGYAGSGSTGGVPTDNPVNTPAENDLLAQLVSPDIGMDAAQFPDWGSLLVGPLYRGTEVSTP